MSAEELIGRDPTVIPYNLRLTWVNFNDARTGVTVIEHLNIAILDPCRMVLTMRFSVLEANFFRFAVDHADSIVVARGEYDVTF